MDLRVARILETGIAYKIVIGNNERKGSLRCPRLRWKKNIKMNVRELGQEDDDWIHLIHKILFVKPKGIKPLWWYTYPLMGR
jgi:hypothetical protein